MGDLREYSELSEDKTEPFSQSEIQARLQRARMEEFSAMGSTVPLDKLVVPPDDDIRILMRPLSRDRAVREDQNLMPLALRAEEEDDAPHQVLAVRQTSRDINFTVTIPDYTNPSRRLTCVLYYDPASDNQILVNRSNVPFTLSRISEEPKESRGEQHQVNPDFNKALAPGTWRITMDGTDLLDFRLLERRPVRLRAISSSASDRSGTSDVVNSSGKRSFVAQEDDAVSPEKRRRPSDAVGDKKEEDRVIMLLPAKIPSKVEKGKELSASTSHPLLDLQPDETLEVPRGGGLVGYTITKKEPIASTALSSVFTAEYSEAPGRYVVVKVLRTMSPAATNSNNEGAVAKNVIRQAQTWLRELENQERLNHKSIVRLYGGDARFLSLYMEPVDGRDLSAKGTWRTGGTDLFAGDRSDALRILQDIASALHYLHGKGFVHNDIKPGNILYNRERGAVLCDLGLSSEKPNASFGGTPWYVPPEFIGLGKRGAPSDVWALGVVMLYVTGKISWPDVRAHRAHPRHLYWSIAHVHERDRSLQTPAVTSMRRWLSELTAVRSGLDIHDKLERLVHGMLAPNPKERLTTKDIVNQLFVEQAAER
ncbi:kinase-like domain-containing protein [Achaetomium macrosporum]|uniref:Kinase-like domain-containing protein n=1 Tax=Achaetomium macrosporum TaxID=79813 RepID=A0AAN7H912_9PEZI|nr:kinase-like domain-containing protein [Achaetomium macrosporum]